MSGDDTDSKPLYEIHKEDPPNVLETKTFLIEAYLKHERITRRMSEEFKHKNLKVLGAIAVLFAAIGAFMLTVTPENPLEASKISVFGVLQIETGSIAIGLLAVSALILIYGINRMFR